MQGWDTCTFIQYNSICILHFINSPEQYLKTFGCCSLHRAMSITEAVHILAFCVPTQVLVDSLEGRAPKFFLIHNNIVPCNMLNISTHLYSSLTACISHLQVLKLPEVVLEIHI